jgi:ferredoxin
MRGVERKVKTPFDRASDICIGCNACVAVCPTGHVVSVDKGAVRHIETWKTKLEMVRCEVCGRAYMPVKELEYLQAKLGEQTFLEKVCPMCRKSQTVARLEDVTANKEDIECAVSEYRGMKN